VLNKDLSPNAPVWMQNKDGSTATVEKLDDTTVQWTFAQPNTAFLLNLANMDGADRSITNLAFVPAHYMKGTSKNGPLVRPIVAEARLGGSIFGLGALPIG
jgi:ABC-type transport system substrate-binding protein